MIRLGRGPEPDALTSVRTKELARLQTLAAAGGLPHEQVGTAYALVKSVLWRQQLESCCYCERNPLESSFYDVEHFRPKARVDRKDGSSPQPGYWWLAWTWENLLFSCAICNRSAKNDAFPLEPGSVPLAPHHAPPGQELPSLIDPYEEDPVDLIQFVFDGAHWQPIGRNGSSRGQRTVEILKLGRPELLTLYDAHIKDFVRPFTDETLDAIARNDAADVESTWRRVVRTCLFPRRPFVALSFDAIDHFVPALVRTQWRLTLPKPSIRGP